MPRSGASLVSFDEGWEWTDPEPRRGRSGQPAYYDWSQDETFPARRRRLQAVPDLPVTGGSTPARATAPRPAEGLSSDASAPLAPEPASDAPPAPAPLGRRTITITGRGADRHLPARRPTALPVERMRSKPDRIAMWAVLLGVLMILAAATSAHAAVLH